ncbi:hypothetical protein AAFF_G00436810 [Aldrovandia affinis]|uniref:Uncharacterized protein n=1 Tax=Aldrovandia affinis TaxID=143900 RepID=A0AAD7S801_9TELE|nr:hypothetical protein AAFF_G00436810 [Aldrovandia affinis]
MQSGQPRPAFAYRARAAPPRTGQAQVSLRGGGGGGETPQNTAVTLPASEPRVLMHYHLHRTVLHLSMRFQYCTGTGFSNPASASLLIALSLKILRPFKHLRYTRHALENAILTFLKQA